MTAKRLSVLPGYEQLAAVLDEALAQAQSGKGKERHASNEPFQDQQIVQLGEWMCSTGFEIGQACKKSLESMRMPTEAAIQDILGAINYLVAAIIVRRRIEERGA